MLAFKTVVLSALALTNIAIAAPLASPAGGPQGPSNYDLGTVLNFAVLQPSGEDFICSNYTTGTSSGGSAPVFVNGHSSGDPTPPLQFVVTSTSDSDDSQAIDFVGLQGYGVVLDSEGQVVIEEGETTDGFFVNGHILGHAFAPDGFYCKCCLPSQLNIILKS